ncbi:MAG: hypothetical protein ABSC22_14145 [Roseiarcus sp.]|jgi:hypothetical protein
MGFSISWLGFEGASKADVLARLDMVDTEVADEANEAPYSIAQLPTGWTILYINDFDLGDVARLLELSRNGRVVACQVEEHAMVSAASAFLHSREEWSVAHDSGRGIYDVSTRGRPPESFADIHRRLAAEQDDAGGERAEVDYIFDAPVELAAAVTGYRHDGARFAWGEPQFTVVAAAR